MKALASARPTLQVAEPPPAYLGRPPLVLDCSVLSALLFEEETRDEALQVVAGRSFHAPLLLDSEIVSVAAKKHRAGLPAAVIARALSAYARQAIQFHRPDLQAQYDLALSYGVSTYDAAYLWVAGVVQAPLATFDARLAKAARAHLGGTA